MKKKRNPAAPKKGSELVVVIPDIHFPNEDKEALAVAKRVIATVKPDRTVILGDMLDAAPFSSHAPRSLKELREYNFIEEEIEPGKDFLSFVESNTKKETVFLEGNHEYRALRWAIEHGSGAQAIYDAISPQVQLTKGREAGFTYIPYVPQRDIGFSYYNISPNLVALHGWSTAKSCARIHLDKAHSKSVVFGHVHKQVSEAKRDPFSNNRIVAWSPGCLCDLQPSYMMANPSEWVHGISFVYIGRDPNHWTEYNLTIERGKVVLPDGSEINGD